MDESRRVNRRRGRLALGALLLGAFALRRVGLGFGLPFPYANPDEHLVTDHVLALLSGDPNPHYFAYPSLCFELHALAALLQFLGGFVGGAWHSLAEFRERCWLEPATLLWTTRTVTLLFATVTVWAVGRLASELARAVGGGSRGPASGWNRPAIVASFALALSALHVANSRFTTVDVPSLFFATLALVHSLKTLRKLPKGRFRDLWLAALFAGLAASCKYYGAIGALAVGGAALLGGCRSGATRAKRVLAAAAITIGAFLATSPYIVLDFATFAREFGLLQSHVEGGHLGQDASRSGVAVYAELLVSREVGLWLVIPAALGLLVALRRAGGRAALLLVLVPAALHFALIASFKSHPSDYLLALLPPLAALFAVGVGALRPAPLRWLAVLPCLIGGWFALADGLALQRPDTRVLARSWFEAQSAITAATSAGNHGAPTTGSTAIASDTWLDLPLTADCLATILEGRKSGAALPLRRGRDEPIEQIETRLAAARRTESTATTADRSAPTYDSTLLTPLELDLRDELPPLLHENGFRWLVLDGSHAARAKRSGGALAERTAWFEKIATGPCVAARFEPGEEASGPLLVVVDVLRLAERR